MTYRLLAGAETDIDQILLRSAAEWGVDAAERYLTLMLTVFALIGETPALPGSSLVRRVPGIRVYPLRFGRRLIPFDQRVGRPRHLAVYRIGADGVVEIMGLVHDRILLARTVRRIRREAGA